MRKWIVLLWTTTVFAIKPPAYLRIPNFHACLQAEQHQTWRGWCMPHTRPTGCSCEAWQRIVMTTVPQCHQASTPRWRTFWQPWWDAFACRLHHLFHGTKTPGSAS